MGDQSVDLLPGTLDMLILKAAAGGPTHGFGVARWIEDVTRQRLTVEEGALYPALHRMEKRGWMKAEWRVTENKRRAKYYRLTGEGRRELAAQVEKWQQSSWAVDRVLKASP